MMGEEKEHGPNPKAASLEAQRLKPMIFKEIHRSKIEFEHEAVGNFKVSEACIFYILSLEY